MGRGAGGLRRAQGPRGRCRRTGTRLPRTPLFVQAAKGDPLRGFAGRFPAQHQRQGAAPAGRTLARTGRIMSAAATQDDSPPILHHYGFSPFAEKIRLALGIKGLRWRSVIAPSVLPKPELVALT